MINHQPPFGALWAGLVPLENLSGYLIQGCKAGKRHALGATPERFTVTGSSPLKAYRRLADVTGHAWFVAVREHDLLNLDRAHWTQMVRGIPKIKLVSEQLWTWAKPIWEGAIDDRIYWPETSSALWLALTAAREDELRAGDEVLF